MKGKKKKLIGGLAILCGIICLFCMYCVFYFGGWKTHYEVIEDISYDNTGRSDCVVYLKENGEYEPYLVLDSDYGENVLLLRQYLLNETRPYKENEKHGWQWGEFGSYYPESTIDDFLNTEFLDTLDNSVRNAIVESDIEVTDKSCYGSYDRNSLTISRKVFLISLEELGYDAESLYTAVKEGKNLKYFTDNYRRRTTTKSNGDKCPYWTRTPHLWDTCRVSTIGDDMMGAGAADINSGVRPAFCIKKGTPVTESTEIRKLKKVYVIE